MRETLSRAAEAFGAGVGILGAPDLAMGAARRRGQQRGYHGDRLRLYTGDFAALPLAVGAPEGRRMGISGLEHLKRKP